MKDKENTRVRRVRKKGYLRDFSKKGVPVVTGGVTISVAS